MLREDPGGGFTGTFTFEGGSYQFHARGYGRPLLITGSLTAGRAPYTWRYLNECLAGSNFVYALDVERLVREGGHAPRYCARLVAGFLRDIVGTRATIVAGRGEARCVTEAAKIFPRFVARVIMACPGSVREVSLGRCLPGRASPGGPAARSRTGPVMPGPRACCCPGTWKTGPPNKSCRWLFTRSQRGLSPVRLCEEIVGLLS